MNAEQIRQGQKLPDRNLNSPNIEEEIDLYTCKKCGDETPNEDLCDDCMDEEVSKDQIKEDIP